MSNPWHSWFLAFFGPSIRGFFVTIFNVITIKNNSYPGKTGFEDLTSREVDKQNLTLGLNSCCFEGSMYLFLFFWSPALESSHILAHYHSALPFGIIFASFIGAMMFGSMLFTHILADERWMTCRELLQTVVVLASGSLVLTMFFRSNRSPSGFSAPLSFVWECTSPLWGTKRAKSLEMAKERISMDF